MNLLECNQGHKDIARKQFMRGDKNQDHGTARNSDGKFGEYYGDDSMNPRLNLRSKAGVEVLRRTIANGVDDYSVSPDNTAVVISDRLPTELDQTLFVDHEADHNRAYYEDLMGASSDFDATRQGSAARRRLERSATLDYELSSDTVEQVGDFPDSNHVV
ncbi:hypothetical protein H7X69_00135 [Candidatus Saccharibacteria bacterium]|nr:hypothetical protein [Candidatus Saccharibacteria bacterium]